MPRHAVRALPPPVQHVVWVLSRGKEEDAVGDEDAGGHAWRQSRGERCIQGGKRVPPKPHQPSFLPCGLPQPRLARTLPHAWKLPQPSTSPDPRPQVNRDLLRGTPDAAAGAHSGREADVPKTALGATSDAPVEIVSTVITEMDTPVLFLTLVGTH